MNSNRRASSGHNHVGAVTSPSPSGVTSVWVGSRPSKDPPRPPPAAPKVMTNNHSAQLRSTPATTTSDQSPTDHGHWKTRRISTGTGNGEYVVVSVRNSISAPAGEGRRNSTVITPMSTDFAARGPFPSPAQTSSDGNQNPFPSTSSMGGVQPQSSSAFQTAATSTGSVTNGFGNGLSDSGKNSLANEANVTGNILSNSQNVFGNSALFGTSGSGSLMANSLYKGSNFLSSLNNTGNLFPQVAPNLNMLPLTTPPLTPSLNSLLFPQTSGLSAYLLASSINQTLNLSQLPNLKQSAPYFPQTSSILGLTQSSLCPIPSVGQVFPQTTPLLGFPQLPFLPLPSAIPLNMLSSSLSSTNQPLLSSNPLQLPTLFPTPSLPLTTMPGNISTEASAPQVHQNLTKSRSAPPILNPKPSEAFRARRASLKARSEATREVNPPQKLSWSSSGGVDQEDDNDSTNSRSPPPVLNPKPSEAFQAKIASLKAIFEAPREVKPPKRLSWSSSGVDQDDDKMTAVSGVAPSVPSRRSSSTSLPDIDSVCEEDYPESEDEVYLPVVTVEPCYDPPYDPRACMRCGKKVYTMEKQVGPVRRVLFHQPCFTCVACGTALTLNSYQLNDDDKGDLNVYCASHKPWVRPSVLDSEALLLQQAVLTLPRPQIYA
ncbi:hypothetical protein ACOMHN_013753 [Nucella lapillus]